MQACSLFADDIACRRGETVLLRGFSANLKPGDALHITGANGIGKSSLMRILAGLLPPFAGAVTRQGAVGLHDERPALDPQLPLASALRFWGELDGTANPLTHAELLGIDDLLDVPFRYLSTGQRKRAAFARLLGQNAPIWLLDEPLNGLDTHSGEQVISLIADHCDNGGLCVIASHQPVALPHCRSLALEEYAP